MRYLLVLFCVAIFASCKQTKHPVNEINRIEFARSGAWQDWGAAISIDSTLTYKYYGRIGHETTETWRRYFYTGKASSRFWDSLNRKLEKIKFKEVQATDNMNIVDVHYFELVVYWKDKKRKIVRVWDEKQDSVSIVLKWINDSYKTVRLKQVVDTIKFETTLQNPSPISFSKGVKFPPPTKNKLLN